MTSFRHLRRTALLSLLAAVLALATVHDPRPLGGHGPDSRHALLGDPGLGFALPTEGKDDPQPGTSTPDTPADAVAASFPDAAVSSGAAAPRPETREPQARSTALPFPTGPPPGA